MVGAASGHVKGLFHRLFPSPSCMWLHVPARACVWLRVAVRPLSAVLKSRPPPFAILPPMITNMREIREIRSGPPGTRSTAKRHAPLARYGMESPPIPGTAVQPPSTQRTQRTAGVGRHGSDLPHDGESSAPHCPALRSLRSLWLINCRIQDHARLPELPSLRLLAFLAAISGFRSPGSKTVYPGVSRCIQVVAGVFSRNRILPEPSFASPEEFVGVGPYLSQSLQ